MAKKKAAGITIPGTKVKAPPWAIAAAGGGVLAVLFLMRDSDGDQPGAGASFGFFAEEVAQRMDDERRIFAGSLDDINDQLAELRDQRIEDKTLPDQPKNVRSERGSETTFEKETVWFAPEQLDLPGSGIDTALNRQQQAEADRLNAIAAGYASGQIIGTAGGTPVVKSEQQISTRSDRALQAETDRWTAQAEHYGAKIGDPSPAPKVTAESSAAAKTTASIQERFNKLQAERLAAEAQKSGGLQRL